jgi:alpha-tubulin suppressor-like RCC1 family protein
MTDNTVYGTGYNGNGQLGLGNTNNVNELTQMTITKTPNYIYCGSYYTIISMTDNTLYATGQNSFGQLGIGLFVVSNRLIEMILPKIPLYVSNNYNNTIVLMTDNTLYGTGGNYNGDLGLGDNNSRSILSQINTLDKTPKYVACNFNTMIVLMTDGYLYGAGSNASGELGLGNITDVNILTQIPLSGKTVRSVSTGSYHTIVLMTDNTIYGTGLNNYGELGLGNNIQITSLTQITIPDNKTPLLVVTGSYSTFVLMTDGSLYGTGYNSYGELGLGNNTDVNVLTLIPIPDNKTPLSISGGGDSYYHTIVLMTDGTVWIWF